ncbi:ExbD/TolR family protein [uncultured Roseicyclus sp.]|jgi:biopolymer transport protein TolR|uniref:ExbD/TolR family protein n=1 Tax=uncultured Roseicyclus sp. TaxID=543072 RepID=UPI002622D060|nr:ExbD/TolR family protein [uncultured Roseicyclus sp.]
MGVSVSTNSGSRRRGRGRRANLKPMSEINVTPFVDVILCLLIIFMVAAPLMTVGVPIDLPDTAAEALPSEDEEPLTVTLAPDGQVMIQTTPVPMADLITRLQAVATERTSTRIFLRADGAIPYDDVMRIMGALNAGGFREIGLVTDSGGPRLNGAGE